MGRNGQVGLGTGHVLLSTTPGQVPGAVRTLPSHIKTPTRHRTLGAPKGLQNHWDPRLENGETGSPSSVGTRSTLGFFL